MKKLVAVFATAFLFTLGLVSVSEVPASAACPYSSCINTTTTVQGPGTIKRGHRARISVTVTAPGNVAPQGSVNLAVTRNGRLVDTASLAYAGGTIKLVTSRLTRKGHYVATATFVPPPLSVFNGSSGTDGFKVKRNPNH
jgi:multidrug efflux pump subunit AcrA (membrane-fusion protein)